MSVTSELQREESNARWRWPHVALLLAALVVALAVRVTHVDPTPSFDELWHLRLSAAKDVPLAIYLPDQLYMNPWNPTSLDGAPPIWRVWTGMDGVLHPPLYALTLRAWRDVVGGGNHVATAYSIVWSLIAIGFTFAAARLAMGAGIAFAVSLAIAASTTQVYFAQEIRAYAMLGGLSAICLWLMTRIERFGPTRRRAVALAAMTLPLLLTHYFAFGAALGIAAFGCARLGRHRRAFLVALASCAAIYAIVWLPFAVRQIKDLGSGDTSFKVAHRDLRRELGFFLNAPFRQVVDRRYTSDPSSMIASVLLVLPWFLVGRLRPLFGWAAVLCGTLCGLLALDFARSTEVLWLTRYAAVAGPAVFLAFVGCGWAIDRRVGYVMAGSLALMGAINLYAGIGVDLDVQSFGDVTGVLAKRAKAGEGLAVYGGLQDTFYGDALLMTCSNATDVPRGPYINMSKPLNAAQAAQLGRRLWVVCGASTPWPDEIVPGARVLWQDMLNGNVYIYYVALDAESSSTLPTATAAPSSAR